MPLSDRGRKILWALAGNHCSLCRCELIQAGTEEGSKALVGEECHIISPRADGPRGTAPAEPNPDLDGYGNLILLCPSDHSRVDQLTDEFTASRLHEIKAAHESWVRTRLGGTATSSVMLRRGSPGLLVEVTTGRELLWIVAGAEQSSLDNEDPLSQEEVDLVGDFLQSVFDASEMWDESEPALRTQIRFDLGQQLTALHDHGWRVFAALNRLVGGGPARFPCIMGDRVCSRGAHGQPGDREHPHLAAEHQLNTARITKRGDKRFVTAVGSSGSGSCSGACYVVGFR